MPTVRWIDVNDLQPPFDSGALDGNGRAQYVFNILVLKVPSATFLDEIVAVLEGAGVGTYGVDIFTTSKAVIPTGAGPYLSVVATGGAAGVRTHTVRYGPAYERPTAQLTARALESVVQGERLVGVPLVILRRTADFDFPPVWQREPNMNLVETAGEMMAAGSLDDDSA